MTTRLRSLLGRSRPRPARPVPVRAVVGAAVLALVLPLAGCGGDDGDGDGGGGDSPEEALTAAKEKFDDAESVRLRLSTESTPTSGDAVLGADGTLTQQPAFEGEVKVVISGFTADVPIVSLDGEVLAKLPMTPKYTAIDPAEYGAPDPADFVDPDAGISTLLTQLEDVEEGEQTRQGDLILTTYTGTLPGERVKPIIPSADEKGTYETEIGLDEDGLIRTLEVTGDFFEADGDVTYEVTLDDYDKPVTVKKP